MHEIQQSPEKPKRVAIDVIHADPAMQVRVRGVDFGTVKQYATILRGDPNCMPPITVAQVGERLLVVDGWHRLAAHREAGLRYLQALVVKATREEALWMAASANLKNPRPLSKKDLLQAFRMYIKGRHHRKPAGGFKSYRDIAKDFANVRAHTTFRNWMEKEYPSIFRAMRAGDVDEEAEAAARRRGGDKVHMAAAVAAMESARDHIAAMGPPRNRTEVLAALAELAREAGVGRTWTPEDEPPF